MSKPRSPSEDWHWDNDRRRWVYMGNYGATNPTYRWEIRKNHTIYDNRLMMDAIDVACSNMSDFPDANTIISQIKRNLDDVD